jgi:hypothetical protein
MVQNKDERPNCHQKAVAQLRLQQYANDFFQEHQNRREFQEQINQLYVTYEMERMLSYIQNLIRKPWLQKGEHKRIDIIKKQSERLIQYHDINHEACVFSDR